MKINSCRINDYLFGSAEVFHLEDDIQRPYTRDIQWVNGQLCIKGKLVHREDGPAIVYSSGEDNYYQYGKLHRIGGPAVKYPNGSKEYWENGERHREDGAAIFRHTGKSKIYEYWLCGKRFKTKKDMIHYRDYLMIM